MAFATLFSALVSVLAIFLASPRAVSQAERGSQPGEPTYSETGRKEFAPGKIIVKLEDDATPADLRQINRENNARTEETVPGADLSVVDLPAELAVREAVRKYEADPDIEYAEPDFVLEPTRTPNDTYYSGYMWDLNNTGQTGGTPGDDIDAPEAWDITTGGPDTLVAVIDTGVDINHPDLRDNIWVNEDEVPDNGVDDDNNGYVDDVNGWDFANEDNTVYDPDPVTGEGDEHGTHVAGTIAAVGNNDRGVTGVSWQAEIMPLKFLGPNGGYTSDAVEAIRYAVDNGAGISNNSWGGGGKSQALQDAIAYAGSKGHLFVAAAGNSGNDNDTSPSYPASYDNPNIISVAATDDNDALASFSNYGEKSVDLGAPGVNILSTVPGGYAFYSGTSMATPHVSGVAALVKTRNPGFDDADLKSRILGTIEAVPGLGGKTATGGRLNAARALGVKFTKLSFAASPRTVKVGAGTRLSGKLTTTSGDALGGRRVVLQQRPVGGTFSNAGEATTGSGGAFDFSGIKPQKHTDYRVRFPGNSAGDLRPSTSRIQRVNVKVSVTLNTKTANLKLGYGRVIRGAVFPNHAGSSVTVTIKRNGSVISRKSLSLNRYSRYSFKYKPGRPGTYAFFATFPKDDDHLGNHSPQKSFKVVR